MLAFGGTLLTTSAVVACFLAGLASGAWLLGPLAERSRNPLRLYGAIEAGVAAYALASPWLAAVLRGHVLRSPVTTASVLAWSALFLIPPTFLMGGTFPAILEALLRHRPRERPAALLYGANTLGAVAGVIGAGFVLIPAVGITRTALLAGAVNALAAVAALALAARATPSPAAGPASRMPAPLPVDVTDGRPMPRPAPGWPLAALALSGFAALIGEIAWTRALGLVLGSSTYSFAIVLAAFLLGTAAGSLRYARHPPSADPLADMVHFELRAATAAALFAFLVTASPRFLILALRQSAGHPAAMAAAAFVVALAATGYATMALGAAFAAGLAAVARTSVGGGGAGRAYAVDTIGAVAGALAAGVVFIPRLGLATTLALGVACNLVAAAVAARLQLRPALLALGGSMAALWLLPAWLDWSQNRKVLVSGVYAYAYKYAHAGVAPAASLLPPPERSSTLPSGPPGIVFSRDGQHANVAVTRDEDGDLQLLIDGKVDASTSLAGDMRTQLLLGHLPALLHAGRPRTALVIGLGSGVTASALALHPLESLDVVELEPVVADVASRYFSEANRKVLADPRLHLVLGDGRSWLARARGRYDIVTSEPSNLWMSGVANLFTVESFAEAGRSLRPDGVLCQWMHLYQVSAADVQMVLRGLAVSFPHVAMFLDGPDLLILASRSPLRGLQDVLPTAAVAADLERVGIGGPAALASLAAGDRRALDAFAGPGAMNTDDRPILEFTAPLSIASDRSAAIAGGIRAAVRREGP